MGHAKLPMKQNNLMGTGNNFAQSQNKFNNSMNEAGWGGNQSQFSDSRGLLDANSNFGSQTGSNMFHPRARDET